MHPIPANLSSSQLSYSTTTGSVTTTALEDSSEKTSVQSTWQVNTTKADNATKTDYEQGGFDDLYNATEPARYEATRPTSTRIELRTSPKKKPSDTTAHITFVEKMKNNQELVSRF
ncbi:unnamed protein product [Anisakis simplex]|uniref:Uncharacterized protein n=1 Tax=Anisakis simplex TaxID=6269 RepID=A0A0M3KIL9_ANISI|nr:unnamed protein product [Anisakis simplex]